MTQTMALHADGFYWVRDVISNTPSHTLIDPEGHQVAHVYRVGTHTWRVLDAGTGAVMADGCTSAGAGLKAAEHEYRPCAYVDTHASHGIMPCDNERQPGSIYCDPHARGMSAAEPVVIRWDEGAPEESEPSYRVFAAESDEFIGGGFEGAESAEEWAERCGYHVLTTATPPVGGDH